MSDTDFDPGDHTVAEVLEHLEENPADVEAVLESERAGKARKGILEAAVADEEEPRGDLGPVGATTTLREDYAGRDLVNPGTTAVDYMGRATTSTVDYMGVPLRRTLRANSTAVALGAQLQFATGEKFTVKTAGTTAASAPTVPAVGADVTDGTAVLTRTR